MPALAISRIKEFVARTTSVCTNAISVCSCTQRRHAPRCWRPLSRRGARVRANADESIILHLTLSRRRPLALRTRGGHPLPPGDGSCKPGVCGKGGTPSAEVQIPDPIVDFPPPLDPEPGARPEYRRQMAAVSRTSQSGGCSAHEDRRPCRLSEHASTVPLLPAP